MCELPLLEAPQDHASTGDEPNGAGIVTVPTGATGGAAKALVVAIKARANDAAAKFLVTFMVVPSGLHGVLLEMQADGTLAF
jgi:hypothetical protein